MSKKPRIFNIQKFSTHDGNGIRTTFFFKGCPLRCKWCHNPESQNFQTELIFSKEKCKGCGVCLRRCPNGANTLLSGGIMQLDRTKCAVCGVCSEWCPNEARDMAGKEYEIDELVRIAMQDRMFYEKSGGGVTLSGGEVMASDIEYVEELCRRIHKEEISVNIDTCGYAPYEKYERLLPYVDIFLYDIKVLDPQEHKAWTGVDNRLILENLIRLNEAGARICLRMPVIEGVNATQQYILDVIGFLRENRIQPVQTDLLAYHSYGRSKYLNLDRSYDEEKLAVPDKEKMALFQRLFQEHGFQNITIGG